MTLRARVFHVLAHILEHSSGISPSTLRSFSPLSLNMILSFHTVLGTATSSRFSLHYVTTRLHNHALLNYKPPSSQPPPPTFQLGPSKASNFSSQWVLQDHTVISLLLSSCLHILLYPF